MRVYNAGQDNQPTGYLFNAQLDFDGECYVDNALNEDPAKEFFQVLDRLFKN